MVERKKPRMMHETPQRHRRELAVPPGGYSRARTRKARGPRTPARRAISAVAAGGSCIMRVRWFGVKEFSLPDSRVLSAVWGDWVDWINADRSGWESLAAGGFNPGGTKVDIIYIIRLSLRCFPMGRSTSSRRNNMACSCRKTDQTDDLGAGRVAGHAK